MPDAQKYDWVVDGIRMNGEVDTNGAIRVSSPDLPELLTEADTVEKAQEQSRDALALVVDYYKDEGKALPPSYTPAAN